MLADPMVHLVAVQSAEQTPGSSTNWVLQIVVPLATPILAFAGVWYQNRRKDARSSKQIKQAVDVYNMLPEPSIARPKLLEHIDQLADQYVDSRTSHRRDWSGVTLAMIFIAAGIYCGYLANADGGWWNTFWAPMSLLLLFGLVGMGTSLPKRDRDAAGAEVEHPPGGRSDTSEGSKPASKVKT